MVDLRKNLQKTLIVSMLLAPLLPAFAHAESQSGDGTFSNVEKINTTFSRSYAIQADGSLWAWGDNTSGELGNGSMLIHAWSPSKVRLDDVKDVSGGSFWSAAVKTDGTLWTWGKNDSGQLGIGDDPREHVLLPQKLELDRVVSVSTAIVGSFAIREDGTLWTWGDNFGGILGYPEQKIISKPVQIPGLENIVKVDSNGFYTFALTGEGDVWGWGTIYTSQEQVTQEPHKIEELTDMVDIAIHDGWYTALKRDGTVWQWNYFYVDRIEDIAPPHRVQGLPAIASLPAGNGGIPGAVDTEGNVWLWNNNGWGPQQVQGVSRVKQLAGERSHWLALTEDRHIYAWGTNGGGVLGINQVTGEAATPVKIMKPVSVTVNGKGVALPIAPLMVSSRTFVPLRGVLEHMDVEVRWDAGQRKVFLSKEGIEVVLQPGSEEAMVNGSAIRLEEPSIIVNDRVFVPLRFVSEAMGASVAWDDRAYEVTITY